MFQNYEQEKMVLWGKEWVHSIEPLPNDPDATTGCLLDVFFNSEVGKFALLYIRPEEININFEYYDIFFEEIHKKWINNVPYILFNDIKYKDICIIWNNSSNTVYEKIDFENLLKNIR
ncbi:MAG: hypothetical protein LBV17_06195 [Treponema sp.]|jgi:hypothetical protein|nr:hypothetical protein [Treponema sp.]